MKLLLAIALAATGRLEAECQRLSSNVPLCTYYASTRYVKTELNVQTMPIPNGIEPKIGAIQ